MKKIVLILVAFLSITSIKAQDSYKAAMVTALEKMKTAKTPEELQDCANMFERIGATDDKNWEANYYAALATTSQIWMLKDTKQIDILADKADEFATKADNANPNNSEILTLKAMIMSGRIMADPASRGMKYGKASAGLLNEAVKLDSTNPRPILQQGYSKLYTPAMFGGSKKKAKELFEQAIKMFATFKPASEIAPIWGLDQAQAALEQCK